jgi:hypothetical protein
MQKYENVVAWLIYDMESEGCARGTKVCRRKRGARAKVYLCLLATLCLKRPEGTENVPNKMNINIP